ncbi:MAG TPA: DUF5329 domain-containing protein [Patescibacteria group bacterium]|nr:DUF5329 domain-containing protein [Patescibacteria group bacterium]
MIEIRTRLLRLPLLLALLLLPLSSALLPAATHATELSSSARIEIDGLLSRLGTSECRFYRNGTWYPASKARDHMQVKLDYLVKKGDIASAEDFIEKAGTKSLLSNKPYKVSCPSQDEQPSAVWFSTELRKIRENPIP